MTPKDITEQAEAYATEWYGAHSPNTASYRKVVRMFERAMLAERELAAKIARNWTTEDTIAGDIADEIMRGRYE